MLMKTVTRFQVMYGFEDISGECGDRICLQSGETIEIVGYANNGCNFLVRTGNGSIQIYSVIQKRCEKSGEE